MFPAGTFQYFLLVCGYLAIFLLVRQAAWRAAWPLIGIAALEAALGIWQHFGGTADEMCRGTYANRNHFAGLLEMALPFAVMYAAAVSRRGRNALAACGAWALAALGAFVFLPPDALILRFAQLASTDGLTANGRTELWGETIPLIRAYLPFGCGLGGTRRRFTRSRDPARW